MSSSAFAGDRDLDTISDSYLKQGLVEIMQMSTGCDLDSFNILETNLLGECSQRATTCRPDASSDSMWITGKYLYAQVVSCRMGFGLGRNQVSKDPIAIVSDFTNLIVSAW